MHCSCAVVVVLLVCVPTALLQYRLDGDSRRVLHSGVVSHLETQLVTVEVQLTQGQAIKMRVEVSEATEELPILIYLHQEYYSTLLQIPSLHSGNTSLIGRTLCPLDSDNSVNLTLATHSKRNISFVLELGLDQYLLTLDQPVTDLSVSKTQSQVLAYQFVNASSEVLLRVESTGVPACTIIAVHPAQACPFNILQDMESNLKMGELVSYQTMLEKSIMIVSGIENPTFLKYGFNIFILGTSDPNECNENIERSFIEGSRVSVKVEHIQSTRLLSTVLTISMYLFSCLVGIFLLSISAKYNIELVGRFQEIRLHLESTGTNLARVSVHAAVNNDSGLEGGQENEQYQISIIGSKSNGVQRRKSLRSENLAKKSTVVDLAAQENDTFRDDRLMQISLEDRTRAARREKQKSRSSQYSWLMITVGIYYTLPVVQLVLLYQSMATQDGNKDLCYYNYECQIPWGIVQDFGNVFSNIGYVCLGLFFITIVAFRRHRYRQFKEEVLNNIGTEYGIPEQYGIFTALGLALTLEGFLSAAYHICPTKRSFQFDTTFMFFIAILLFLKIYQFRHPNVIQTARTVFLLLGIALIFETLGYYAHSAFFTVSFITVYMIILFAFLYHLYWDGSNPSIKDTFQRGVEKCQFLFQNPKKLKNISWPFFSSLLINIVFAILIAVLQEPQDVSNDLLGIFMINMALYLFYYIGMKLYRSVVKKEKNEGIRWISWLYLLLANTFALPSLFFFQQIQRDSNLSPARSRHLNAPCTLGIYDNHDFWHFLSASGLFYLFLFILTIEDGNMEMERKNIHIF